MRLRARAFPVMCACASDIRIRPQGVLYVVDSTDRARIELSAVELRAIMQDDELAVRARPPACGCHWMRRVRVSFVRARMSTGVWLHHTHRTSDRHRRSARLWFSRTSRTRRTR